MIDEITDRLLQMEALNRLQSKSKNKSTKQNQNSASLLRRIKIFRSNELVTMKISDSYYLNNRQKFWTKINLSSKAKNLIQQIHSCDRIASFNRDFFQPFSINYEVESVIKNVSIKIPVKRYEKLLAKIKTELVEGVLKLQKEIDAEIISISKTEESLQKNPELTKESIERNIIAYLLDESSQERGSRSSGSMTLSARRYNGFYSVPIRNLLREFKYLYSEQEILEALSPNNILFQKGHIQVHYSSLDSESWLDVPVYANPELNLTSANKLITDPALHKTEKIEIPNVALKDLIIPPKELSYIHGLIKLYKSGKTSSLSFLFHGPAGTGKTSLAKAIAKELDRKLVTISSSDLSEGDFACALSFLLTKYRASDYFLFFDECERLWYNKHSFLLGEKSVSSENAVSKVILEKTGVAMAFASNMFPPDAFKRRVDYCLELRSPNARIREQLLKSELAKAVRSLNVDVNITEENIRAAASSHSVPVGFYKQAITMASSINSGSVDSESLSNALTEISKGLNTQSNEDIFPKVTMDHLTLSQDQQKIMNNISQYYREVILEGVSDPLMPKSVSVLFKGPSGTGKTVFAEALASKLGIGFRRCSPSNFLNMYLGESERKIKEAFVDAEAKGYLLFIDEIEGLLRDRSQATTSWQLTQVNEFLMQLENFKGIMVAATNHPEMIDPAFARRFLFKIDFKNPSWQQRLEFMRQHLKDIDTSELELVAKKFDLSLGLVRNAVTRLKANRCSGGAKMLEELLKEEFEGFLGDSDKRVGI